LDATGSGYIDQITASFVDMFISTCRVTHEALKASKNENQIKRAEVVNAAFGFEGNQELPCQNGG
jgi:hypothetical protein